jgi:hypothetical protein
MGLDDFLRRWTARRDELATLRASVEAAALIDAMLTELRAAFAEYENTVLTLDAAAARSGYSRDHLARLIRTGVLPNSGRPGAPRLRLCDIPARSCHRAPHNDDGPRPIGRYDPTTDARCLVDRRRGAKHGPSSP